MQASYRSASGTMCDRPEPVWFRRRPRCIALPHHLIHLDRLRASERHRRGSVLDTRNSVLDTLVSVLDTLVSVLDTRGSVLDTGQGRLERGPRGDALPHQLIHLCSMIGTGVRIG